jgi:Rad3-related DNA helicase
MELGLYDQNGPLEPRRYSSGKTQVNLIEEILEAFQSSDIVFLKGTVGSGKSVVGLRTAIEFGRGIVSVPTKVLSDQYVASYERDKYFVKGDRSRARIGILKGRGNFKCPYMLREKGRDVSCAASVLPCTRPLDRDAKERRIDALRVCPYWGFIFHIGWRDSVGDAKVAEYKGIAGDWIWCMKGDCPYWKQFSVYTLSDAIVMNSAKWSAEVCIGRLPKVPVTIVDEADHWLDELAIKVSLTDKTIERIGEKIGSERLERKEELQGLWSDALAGRGDPLDFALYVVRLLDEIDETSGDIYWRLRSVLEHKDWAECEVGEGKIVYFVPDPKVVLHRLLDKVGGKWLLMSATVQSEDILSDVFGITPTFVSGETRFPGTVIHRKIGSEEVVNYRRWRDDGFRQRYWNLLSKIKRRAKRPTFVPVHAFTYLPQEIREKMGNTDALHIGKIMYTTKMDRGADLRGMGSVIILKFPYPDREDPLLKGMERRLGKEAFQSYYRDRAERDFVQQIGRALRSPDDEVEFWSPDGMCHAQLGRLWKGDLK